MARILPIDGPAMQHDGLLHLAVGHSKKDTNWKAQEMLWSALVHKLSKPLITGETVDEYKSMPKADQDNAKDVGGYVKGPVQGGRRKAGSVQSLYLIALDIDYPTEGFWDSLTLLHDFSAVLHSTHSHRPDRPRLRLILPLSRAVTRDEWQAVARKLAADLGIEQFDPTTFEAERLNYWPSIPNDATYIYQVQDGPWLDPDAWLSRYDNWRDSSQWPEVSKERDARKRQAEKAEDPTTKKGLVGSFCRTYSIEDAIETFLPEVYEPCGDGRYSYTAGSTTGGLVLYEDKYAYSHHGTDPVGGRLVNAFDLVRIHRFGDQDDAAKEGTPVGKLPSYLAMLQLASEDPQVRETVGKDNIAAAAVDFGEALDGEDTSWLKTLELTAKGGYASTRNNLIKILENDPRLKGALALNEFTGRVASRKALPWRDQPGVWQDSDDAALLYVIERTYHIDSPPKTADALAYISTRHKFHPIREYLAELNWDGLNRLDTLFIDYLGADDSEYVRAVTRKSLIAAVARVMRPGCKWDYVPVLVGKQGIGKSLILQKLGKRWFSDSLYTVQGKDAYEQLQGAWIVEMGELAATRKAEVESIKLFVSKTSDSYRVAYGRHISEFPRQCVFFGTTNEATFLRDQTGNRRFWPVVVGRQETILHVWDDMTPDTVDQIWAEAVQGWKDGEPLYLAPALEVIAYSEQDAHTEESEKAGAIRDYLDMLLPDNWDDMNVSARREYIHGNDFGQPDNAGTVRRDRVCVMEVWVELFLGDQKNLNWSQAKEIHDILRRTKGWAPYEKGGGRLRFGKVYGIQRAYVRREM